MDVRFIMETKKTLLHVGAGKTGTTSLQENILAKHRKLHNIGRPTRPKEFLVRFLWMLQYAEDDEINWSFWEEFARTEIEAAARDGKKLVFSEEVLTWAPFHSLVAKRLFRLFPNASIMIAIREQSDALKSFWAGHAYMLKHVPKPYHGKKVEWANWLENEFSLQKGLRKPYRLGSWLNCINYDRMIREYESVFGRENIHIVLYEDLKLKPARYYDQVGRLLAIGSDEVRDGFESVRLNTRTSLRAKKLEQFKRKLNIEKATLSRVIPNPLHRAIHKVFGLTKPVKVEMSEDQKARIHNHFREGNTRLSERYGLDLEKFGYAVRVK